MGKVGKVYLVGAGPGSVDLLCFKAIQVLKKADVVIYDRLVSNEILELAPKQAEFIYAGKRRGKHSLTQEQINELLVKKAREGKTVVRLKGGDPFLLGRGGEEAEALREHNIPYEVVPGLSSALAVPAYAGIPATHRKYASSVLIATGQEVPNKSKHVNWKNIAKTVDTIIILMGLGRLQQITKELIEGGLPEDTPVAVVQDGTLKTQRTLLGTLSDIVEKVKKFNIKPPAVVIIGKVSELHKKLSWYEYEQSVT